MAVESKNLAEAQLASGRLTASDHVIVEIGGSIRRISFADMMQAITDNAYRGIAYGTCATSSTYGAKTASIGNFILIKGAIVSIYFQHEVHQQSTLNVSGTGAKYIMYHGTGIQDNIITQGTTAILQYDGQYWQLVARENLPGGADELVDLGLPSGILWAKANIGATLPTEKGYFFSWGNTDPHTADEGHNFDATTYAEEPGADITASLTSAQDAARACLGGMWRMPTSANWMELINNCSAYWDNGLLELTSSINGRTLYLPAAGYFDGQTLKNTNFGYYWAATYHSASQAYALSFGETSRNAGAKYDRHLGLQIRAVR